MPQSDKNRKYFQKIHHTFAVELSQATTPRLEFLDHSDPAKNIVVRKKAREWVNKNRAISKRSADNHQLPKTSSDKISKAVEEDRRVQIVEKDQSQILPTTPINLHQPTSLTCFDPFGLLPRLARKYDHLIEFFVKVCPEQIPGSDDKFVGNPKHALAISGENTVLGQMAKYKVCFVVWLYATIVTRNFVTGCTDTGEVQWFYHQALQVLQDALKRPGIIGEYSEDILNSIGCIMATASFNGMFETTELHRNAMIRILSIRGDGDILAGLRSLTPWTVKALQWCELLVAVQHIETPSLPYYVPVQPMPFPEKVLCEATRLTTKSLTNLPPLSEPLRTIVGLLHHVGIAYAQVEPEPKMNLYIVQPLYDAVYLLLQVLEAQKSCSHGYSKADVLLGEALHLYLWTGPRSLPPLTKLCNLLVSRLTRALLPLLLENETDLDPKNVTNIPTSTLEHSPNRAPGTLHYPRATNNAITWSLALGTVITKGPNRKHVWFQGHLRKYVQSLGLDMNEQAYMDHLELFPATEGFPWINLRTIYRQYTI